MVGPPPESYLMQQQHPADEQGFAFHMTFDVKFDLRQKDRPVLRGLETKAPSCPTQHARLALTIADLDSLRNTLAMC